MREPLWTHSRFRALIVIAALLSAAACHESNTVSGPPGPAASANVAGTWTGTYKTNDAIDCNPSVLLDATATFNQNGSTVTGSLVAPGPCGLNYVFTGTIQGDQLTGTLAAGVFVGSASGRVLESGKVLEIVPVNSYSYEMGLMHLNR